MAWWTSQAKGPAKRAGQEESGMTCKPNTMKREAPHPIARESGPVWQRIGAEARELAAREPSSATPPAPVPCTSS